MDYQCARQLLKHLGFQVWLGRLKGWSTGRLDVDGQQLKVAYAKAGQEMTVLKIIFAEPTTIAAKVSVLNILARHLELMKTPAATSLTIASEKPISTAIP